MFLQRITRYRGEIDRKTFLNQVNSNWFSGNNALRVFSVYVALDKDLDGMYFFYTMFSTFKSYFASKISFQTNLEVLVVIGDVNFVSEPFCPSATLYIL